MQTRTQGQRRGIIQPATPQIASNTEGMTIEKPTIAGITGASTGGEEPMG